MVHSKLNTAKLLGGKRILIFEDGFLLSDTAQIKLVTLGVSILGPVATADRVLSYLATGMVDAVILDVAIEPEVVLPVVSALESRHIPFIFALSSNPSLDEQRFAGFVLSASDDDLATIATALFGQPYLVQ